MTTITKVLATGSTHTVGTDGRIAAGDHTGLVDIHLASPNPGVRAYAFEAIANHPTAEQLFAGAWSACYIGAVGIVAKEMNVALPADTAVDIAVDLGLGGGGYLIQARLALVARGIDPDVLTAIAHGAHDICPYSKATRGNIEVELTVKNA